MYLIGEWVIELLRISRDGSASTCKGGCIRINVVRSLFISGHKIASTISDRDIAPNPPAIQSSKYIMLHFRFSFLYLLKILQQLLHSEE